MLCGPSPNRSIATAVAALITLGGARAVVAQPTGALSGRATAPNGEALAGVTVVVVGAARGAVTAADGSYRMQLRPGRYELRARLIGYASARDSVVITEGTAITKNFTLA